MYLYVKGQMLDPDIRHQDWDSVVDGAIMDLEEYDATE
jgi:hypothetical protein